MGWRFRWRGLQMNVVALGLPFIMALRAFEKIKTWPGSGARAGFLGRSFGRAAGLAVFVSGQCFACGSGPHLNSRFIPFPATEVVRRVILAQAGATSVPFVCGLIGFAAAMLLVMFLIRRGAKL